MKIGAPNHPRRDVIDEIKWIAENNFDFIDLFLESDRADLSCINPKLIKTVLDDYNLDRVGHTAWYLPIGSPCRELRDKAVEIALRYIDAFTEIGCRQVTVHAHWPSALFTEKEGVDFQSESLSKIVNHARKSHQQIMYESVDTIHDHKQNIQKILSNNRDLSFHADIGHLNLFQRVPADYLTAFKAKITHIHMHDNDGLRDLHLPLGAGKIHWSRVIGTLKSFYNGTITLEIFSADRRYLLYSKTKLEELWERG